MPIPEDVTEHYEAGLETGRLDAGAGLVERDRTRDIFLQHAPPPPAVVLDIGGGPGVHAAWLLERGYMVHLVDAVPRHVREARGALERVGHGTWSAKLGDARSLEADGGSADAVLLLGPLYHLTEAEDRRLALREAHRVLKPGGVVFAAAISRFASVLDGIARNLIDDPEFLEILDADLREGQHRNPSKKPDYFATAYFHRPTELRAELETAGFLVKETAGLEGPTWLLSDIGERWVDERRRRTLMTLLARIQSEPELSGLSAHLLAVGTNG